MKNIIKYSFSILIMISCIVVFTIMAFKVLIIDKSGEITLSEKMTVHKRLLQMETPRRLGTRINSGNGTDIGLSLNLTLRSILPMRRLLRQTSTYLMTLCS